MCQTCNTYVKLRRLLVSSSTHLSCFLQFPSLQQHEDIFGITFFIVLCGIYIHRSIFFGFFIFCITEESLIISDNKNLLFDIFGRKWMWGKKRWRSWARTGGLVSCSIMSSLFFNRTRTVNISSTTFRCATTQKTFPSFGLFLDINLWWMIQIFIWRNYCVHTNWT